METGRSMSIKALGKIVGSESIFRVLVIEAGCQLCTQEMESRRMSLSCSWVQQQQFVLKLVVVILVLFCCAVTSKAAKFEKIFVIGDSYQDIGNRDPNNNTKTLIGEVDKPWKKPYGRTTPGSPAGRFTDGKCLGDLLADTLDLKPHPYRILSTTSPSTNVSDGVNFAVGGAGVFSNLGFTKTGDQIAQLKGVLNNGVGGPYNGSVYNKSLIFYGISGNDYATFQRNNANDTLVTLLPKALAFVGVVVAQVTQDLLALYNLGFRSFVVGKLPPLGCVPASTYSTSNFTSCNEIFNIISTTHNTNLSFSVTLSLPANANIIFLNNQFAFGTVVYDLTNPGRLIPCCTGLQNGKLCGDVDPQNNTQYTLCNPNDQSKYFFFDEFHPTEAGWKTIYNLYLQDSFPTFHLYTDGKSLKQFLGV